MARLSCVGKYTAQQCHANATRRLQAMPHRTVVSVREGGRTAYSLLPRPPHTEAICSQRQRRQQRGRLPPPESNPAGLGAHHHAVQVWLREGIHHLKLELAQQQRPNRLDLHVPATFSEPAASRVSVWVSAALQITEPSNSCMSWWCHMCNLCCELWGRIEPGGMQNWCPCSRADRRRTRHS